MLHSYSFSNFQSFLEKTTVDFRVTKKVANSDWIAAGPSGERVSKVMAILGPNGAGKTALLKPVAFFGWFICQSFQNAPNAPIPVSPHFSAPKEPTTFSCAADFDGRIWRYELICTQERVLYEALFRKRNQAPKRYEPIFIRKWDDRSENYDIHQENFGLPAEGTLKVRQNVSLISWAAQYNVPLALRIVGRADLPWVVSNVTGVGRLQLGGNALFAAAAFYHRYPESQDLMARLLASWDLGLTGVEMREAVVQDQNDPQKTHKVILPFGKHVSRGQSHELPFVLESSGTQGAFIHLMRLFVALSQGGIAVIDEFESDLHPHMLEPILGLLANPDINRHNAQLLFTCHAAEVLNILHKSQVTLVEKDEECESHAVRMDKVEGIRNDDNFYAKYMAGTYGAVPRF